MEDRKRPRPEKPFRIERRVKEVVVGKERVRA